MTRIDPRNGLRSYTHKTAAVLRHFDGECNLSGHVMSLAIGLGHVLFFGIAPPVEILRHRSTISTMFRQLDWRDAQDAVISVRDVFESNPRALLALMADDTTHKNRKKHGVGIHYPMITSLPAVLGGDSVETRFIKSYVPGVRQSAAKDNVNNASNNVAHLEAAGFPPDRFAWFLSDHAALGEGTEVLDQLLAQAANLKRNGVLLSICCNGDGIHKTFMVCEHGSEVFARGKRRRWHALPLPYVARARLPIISATNIQPVRTLRQNSDASDSHCDPAQASHLEWLFTLHYILHTRPGYYASMARIYMGSDGLWCRQFPEQKEQRWGTTAIAGARGLYLLRLRVPGTGKTFMPSFAFWMHTVVKSSWESRCWLEVAVSAWALARPYFELMHACHSHSHTARPQVWGSRPDIIVGVVWEVELYNLFASSALTFHRGSYFGFSPGHGIRLWPYRVHFIEGPLWKAAAANPQGTFKQTHNQIEKIQPTAEETAAAALSSTAQEQKAAALAKKRNVRELSGKKLISVFLSRQVW